MAAFNMTEIKLNSAQAASVIYPNKYNPIDHVVREIVRSYFNADQEFKDNIMSDYSAANFKSACFDFEMETGLNIDECHSTSLNGFVCKPHGIIDGESIIMVRSPYSAKDSGEFKGIQSQSHYYAKAQFQMHVFNVRKCYFYQWSPVASSNEIIEYSESFFEQTSGSIKSFLSGLSDEISNPEKHLVDFDSTSSAKKLAEKRSEAIEKINLLKCVVNGCESEIIALAAGGTKNIGGVLVRDGKII